MKLSKIIKRNGVNNEKYFKCSFKKVVNTIINNIVNEDVIDCSVEMINENTRIVKVLTSTNETVIIKVTDTTNERQITNSNNDDIIILNIENDRLDSCVIYKETEFYDERIKIINLLDEENAELTINTIYKDRNYLDLVKLSGYGTYNYKKERCNLSFKANDEAINKKVKDSKINNHSLITTIKKFEKFNEDLKRKKVKKRY